MHGVFGPEYTTESYPHGGGNGLINRCCFCPTSDAGFKILARSSSFDTGRKRKSKKPLMTRINRQSRKFPTRKNLPILGKTFVQIRLPHLRPSEGNNERAPPRPRQFAKLMID